MAAVRQIVLPQAPWPAHAVMKARAALSRLVAGLWHLPHPLPTG